MWKVVLFGASLVWSFSTAYHHSVISDWYSNDDGVIVNSPGPHYRNNNNNRTKLWSTQPPNLNTKPYDRARREKSLWVLHFENVYRKKLNLRSFTSPPFKRDDVLNRLQRETTHDEIWRCSLGPDIINDCNHCVCLGGQLYLCTAKKCRHPDYQGKLQYRSYRESNQRNCIEGEEIKSFDCNKCWCSGGSVVCTVNTCSKLILQRHPYLPQDRWCEPGDKVHDIAYSDRCNDCGCDRHGQKYCTANTCSQEPIKRSEPDLGCVKQTWFSIKEGHSTCKECFCTDGRMAFCYMKLCEGLRHSPSGYSPLKLMGSIQKSTCTEGETMHDECSRCVCTYKEEWRCYTRMIDRCSGEGKMELKKSKRNKNPARTQTLEKPPIATTRNSEEGNQEGNHLEENECSDEVESVEVDISISKQPNQEKVYFNAKDNCKGQKRTTESTHNMGSDEYITNKKLNRQAKVTKSLDNVYSDESGEYDDRAPKKPKQRVTPPAGPTKKRHKRPRDPEPDELAAVPECSEGDSFIQSTYYNCQGCFCTGGEWKCFSFTDACRGYDEKWCWEGVYHKNKLIPCSVCYCGKGNKWFCATDDRCSKQIKSTFCDGLNCSYGCQQQGHNYGLCNKDRCVCV